MQRYLWRVAASRRHFATQRLFTTSQKSMVQFMIRKHTSTKGDFRSQGLLRKRLSENESLGSNLVDGPAQPSKVEKVTIVKEETPGPQRSSESKTLDLNSGAIPTHPLRIRRFLVGGNTSSPKSVQQALELGGDWKATEASDIRQLMRRVPHSVAVITSNMPPKGFVGMTVSSFNTVCLEPRVVVSFNVKQPSATLNAIRASGHFTVDLIDSTEQGAAIAELFASGRGREVLKDDDGVVSSTTSPSELEQRSPHLLSDNTVMFTLQCEVLDQPVEVADHVIVLGAVLTHRLPPHGGVWDRTSLGMCYVNRRYRRPGVVQLLPGERARLSGVKYAKKAAPSSTAASLSPKDDSTHEKVTSSHEEVASHHEEATYLEFY